MAEIAITRQEMRQFLERRLAMGMTDLLRRVVGDRQQDYEIVGVIVEAPTLVENDDSSPRTLVFRLDSRPDLVFRQAVRLLAPSASAAIG